MGKTTNLNWCRISAINSSTGSRLKIWYISWWQQCWVVAGWVIAMHKYLYLDLWYFVTYNSINMYIYTHRSLMYIIYYPHRSMLHRVFCYLLKSCHPLTTLYFQSSFNDHLSSSMIIYLQCPSTPNTDRHQTPPIPEERKSGSAEIEKILLRLRTAGESKRLGQYLWPTQTGRAA